MFVAVGRQLTASLTVSSEEMLPSFVALLVAGTGPQMAAGASSAVAEAGDEVDEAAGSVAGAKSIAAGAALLGVRRLQLSSPCTTSGRPRRRLRATMLR